MLANLSQATKTTDKTDDKTASHTLYLNDEKPFYFIPAFYSTRSHGSDPYASDNNLYTKVCASAYKTLSNITIRCLDTRQQ